MGLVYHLYFLPLVVGSSNGCTTAVPGYFKAMREVRDSHAALFILDEIMRGIVRTDKMHAWQWEGLSSPPDIQVNGKGLGGSYVPVATVLVSQKSSMHLKSVLDHSTISSVINHILLVVE